jgi:hypothetical protein
MLFQCRAVKIPALARRVLPSVIEVRDQNSQFTKSIQRTLSDFFDLFKRLSGFERVELGGY